jgi:hypothetical protein
MDRYSIVLKKKPPIVEKEVLIDKEIIKLWKWFDNLEKALVNHRLKVLGNKEL